jgi:beta-lactam-binding protein with PASTA domain
VNQSPEGGTSAQTNSNVTLEVAIAPSAAGVTVPNVVSLTREAARSQLVTGGFNVEEIFEPAPAGTNPMPQSGHVWRQSPAAGSPKPASEPVRISIQP